MHHRSLHPRVLRAGLLAALVLGTTGCLSPVPFHERRLLADPAMVDWEQPGEDNWYGKVIQSMEGSVGDVGTSGGGGCGCY